MISEPEVARVESSNERLVYASTSLFRDIQGLLRLALGNQVEMSMEGLVVGSKDESVRVDGTLIGWSARTVRVPRPSRMPGQPNGTTPRIERTGKVLGTYRYETLYDTGGARPSSVRLRIEIDPSSAFETGGRADDQDADGQLTAAIRDASTRTARFLGSEVELSVGDNGFRGLELDIAWPPESVKTTTSERRPQEMMEFIDDSRKIAPLLNERVFSGAKVLFAPPTNYLEHQPIASAPGWLVSGNNVVGPVQLCHSLVGAEARLEKSVGFVGCPGVERFYRSDFRPEDGVRMAGDGLAVEVRMSPIHRTPVFIFTGASEAGSRPAR